MAYTPLCSISDLTSTPLSSVLTNWSQTAQSALIIEGSRAVESYCGARLSPFTITESVRAQMVDPDEQVDAYTPLDTIGQLGLSRAQSLGASDLVRHCYVRERPRVWIDSWVGAVSNIVVLRSFSGSQTVAASAVQYETDTGHIRFAFGTYIPQGSTLVTTYSGGYNPVPDELKRAAVLRCTLLAIVEMRPQQRPDVDLSELERLEATLLSPYVAD